MAMNRDEIMARLTEVFREVFDEDELEISEQTSAADIDEWDSLTHITLVISTEREFGLRLNASELGQLKNVGALVDILEERATL